MLKSYLAFAICILVGFSVQADPPNYQKYIIGERALGMGGAYTAAVDDPMAVYYNPGAMGFAETSMISASQNIYSLDYRFIEGGYVPFSGEALNVESGDADAEALEHKQDLTMPSTLAIMLPFGPRLYDRGPKRHVIGISMLVPYQDSYTLRAKWVGDSEFSDEETYSLSESYKTVWTGLSYGFRISREWGIGLSAFISRNEYQRRLDNARFENNSDEDDCDQDLYRCGYLEFKESMVDISIVSAIFKLGCLWAPHPEWRFGLTVTAPSIPIKDMWLYKTEGSLDQTQGLSRVSGTLDDFVEFYTDDYSLDVAGQEPMNFRFGAAFVREGVTAVDLDLAVYLPTSYDRISGDPVADRFDVDSQASPVWFDPGVVRHIERKAVLNANLGAEVFFAENWTVRSGVFTDFSSAPDVEYGIEPQLTKVHRFGAALSVGFVNSGYDLTLGVTGSYGTGTASRYNSVNPKRDENNSDLKWEPAAYEERSIYVFIAGVQKAVVTSAKTLWNKTVDKVKEKRKENEEEEKAEASKADAAEIIIEEEKEPPTPLESGEEEEDGNSEATPLNSEEPEPVQDEIQTEKTDNEEQINED